MGLFSKMHVIEPENKNQQRNLKFQQGFEYAECKIKNGQHLDLLDEIEGIFSDYNDGICHALKKYGYK